MKVMTKIVLLLLISSSILNADTIEDHDMDGVPDNIDKCLNSPFLTEVDSNGCATQELFFPQERDDGSFDIVFGYGYSNNDDDINRGSQHIARLQLGYVLDDWIFSLRSGYITDDPDRGLTDTTFKIKKRFRPTKNFKVSFGVGVRFATYDFMGNNTDYTLYSSAIYYPASGFSLFGGANYTFIKDDMISDPLQNIVALYAGAGYFFSKELYLNASYSYSDTKFANYHKIKTVSSTLFYQFSDQWFVSFSYSHELDDDDLHNSFNVRLGYSLW